jgi:hypothetical protein
MRDFKICRKEKRKKERKKERKKKLERKKSSLKLIVVGNKENKDTKN